VEHTGQGAKISQARTGATFSRVCVVCGGPILGRAQNARVCGDGCRRQWALERKRESCQRSRNGNGPLRGKPIPPELLERAIADVRLAVTADQMRAEDPRPPQPPVVQHRLVCVLRASKAVGMRETGASSALRQSYIELAAVALQAAARMPAPTAIDGSTGRCLN
jgi:hypothetical protein